MTASLSAMPLRRPTRRAMLAGGLGLALVPAAGLALWSGLTPPAAPAPPASMEEAVMRLAADYAPFAGLLPAPAAEADADQGAGLLAGLVEAAGPVPPEGLIPALRARIQAEFLADQIRFTLDHWPLSPTEWDLTRLAAARGLVQPLPVATKPR